MGNPVAEIMDTFFNGRPAPKDDPKTVRVKLSQRQMRQLRQGDVLRFVANGTAILISAPQPESKQS